jgi:dihydrofolate reductase
MDQEYIMSERDRVSGEYEPSDQELRSDRIIAMGLLTFALNVTLDGCCDHRAGLADDALLRYYTRLMDGAGAMLFGRTTYELMESAWPAVARDPKARPAFRAWARKLEAKPKHVVSTTRRDFPWSNTFRVDGNLREAIAALKRRTPRGLLVGSPALSAALEQMGLIDEYRIAVHPVLAGHGPTLFSGLSAPSRLKLVDTKRLKSGVMALRYRRK